MLRHALTRPDFQATKTRPTTPREHARDLVRMILHAGHNIQPADLKVMVTESLKRAFPGLWSDEVIDADRKGLPPGLTREAQNNLVLYNRRVQREEVIRDATTFKVANIPNPNARSNRRRLEIRWG